MKEVQNNLVTLSISPELSALVPKPNNEEYSSILNSIKKDGQLESITVWEDPVSGNSYIVDGHTRYGICNELQVQPILEFKKFENWLDVKKFAIDVNLQRRHLTIVQKVELAGKAIAIEAKLAAQRKRSTIPQKGQKGFQTVSMSDGINTGRTAELVANKIGSSPRTVSRIKFVLENADEELRNKVLRGITKPAHAERQIRKGKAQTKDISLPTGKFNIVYCDAPFAYDFELSGAPDYPTLTQEQIISLNDKDGRPITSVFADDCCIFFWSPKPKIYESCQILESWGFEYKTFWVWRKVRDGKPQRGTGHYCWSTVECLLIATKGRPGTPPTEYMQEDVIEEPRGKRHSEKPDIFRNMIEKMYPNGHYLELFGRKKVSGWEVWGNQIDLPITPVQKSDNLDQFAKTQ